MVQEVTAFYNDFFTTEDSMGWESKLDGIQPSITDCMNSRLIRPVETSEIKKALFSMNPNKAPGMDGMIPLFFQSFWYILQHDICKAVQSFFQSNCMLKSWNHTLLSFIPKVQQLTKISQFRPISLCNVIYKIIYKILANRMKPSLPTCSSENQSALLARRQILDNIVIAQEYIHYLNNLRKEKTSFVALKLDMAKAYDE